MMFPGKKKDKKIEAESEDDGRSFADMNVEGMPWYRPRQKTDAVEGEKIELDSAGYRSFLWGVLKAAFLIGVVFVLVYFLFILFLDVVVFGN